MSGSKTHKLFLNFLVLVMSFLMYTFLPSNSLASGIAPGQISNPVLDNSLQVTGITSTGGVRYFNSLIGTIISFLFIVAVILFLLMLFVGAIRWISSGKDKTALEGARSTIMNAIVGLVVTFSIYAIVSLIEYVFGTDILLLDISSLVI